MLLKQTSSVIQAGPTNSMHLCYFGPIIIRPTSSLWSQKQVQTQIIFSKSLFVNMSRHNRPSSPHFSGPPFFLSSSSKLAARFSSGNECTTIALNFLANIFHTIHWCWSFIHLMGHHTTGWEMDQTLLQWVISMIKWTHSLSPQSSISVGNVFSVPLKLLKETALLNNLLQRIWWFECHWYLLSAEWEA